MSEVGQSGTPLEALAGKTTGNANGVLGQIGAWKAPSETSQQGPPEFQSWQDAVDYLVQTAKDWWREGLALLPNLVVAILILLLALLVAKLASAGVRRGLAMKSDAKVVSSFGASATRVIVMLLGLFVALGVMRLQGTVISLLAGVGIFGIALGFAFKDITENLIIGLMMSIRKPFDAGDVIKTNGYMGFVQAVNLRTTILKDFLGQRIILQNVDVYQNPIENFSSHGYRKIEYHVGLSYGEDLPRAVRVTREALAELDCVQDDDDVEMYGNHFGDFSIDFIVRMKIDYPGNDYFQARHEGLLAIKRAYDAHDILIPWPIRTLDFNAKGGRDLPQALKEAPFSSDGNGDQTAHASPR